MQRLLYLSLAGFVLLNILAYHHAGSFFYYTDGDMRTASPEQMSGGQKLRVLVTGIRVPKPTSHTTPAAWRLDFQSIDVPGRDGLTLSGWVIPSEATETVTVLFHGYSSEKSGLLHEAAHFHDLGHTVVLVDFPGHGGSPGNRTTLGIDEARDVAAVYAWARTTWPERQIVLYGHSMGGAAVMRAIGTLGIEPDAAVVESVFDTLLNAIRFRFALLSAPSFPTAEILLFWGSVRLGVNGFGHDVVAYARASHVPVLVVHGEQDRRAHVEGARRIYDALPGRKGWVLIPGAGHVNPCLTDPQKWQREIDLFVRGSSQAFSLR